MLLGTYCNCLMVLGPGASANILAVTHWLSSLRHPVSGFWGSRLFRITWNSTDCSDHSGLTRTVQVTPKLTQPPRLYSTHGKQGIPPTNGQLGGTTHPIQQHTSTQSIPWPPRCPLTSTTSIGDPSWARPTRQLQGWPCQYLPKTQWPETIQTRPRTSRLLQLTILAHQAHPDHLKTAKSMKNHQKQQKPPKAASGSTGTPCYAQKSWKILEILKTDQVTQYIGLGPPSWLTPTPRYVAHVSYLTTHKAPPEMPCSNPLIRIRRPEWMVLTRGWRSQVFIQITQKTKKSSINWKNWPENTRIVRKNWI